MNAHSMPDQNRMIVDSAEKAVLGALMLSEHAFWQVNDRLRADHFHKKIHQRIFSAIKDVCEEGKKLSQTIVQSRLGDDAEEDGYSIAAYLAVLMTGAEEIDLSVLDFVDQVVDAGERRRLVRIAEQLMKAARTGDKPPIDVAGEAESALLDVMHATAPKRPRRLGELTSSVMRDAFRANDDSAFSPGFDTGLASVDEVLGLILPGDLGFILGSQADGKSSLGAQIGMQAAKTCPVLTFQLEMTAEQQAARELAAASGISVGLIQEGGFDLMGQELIATANQALRDVPFFIHDEGKLTIRQMRAQCLAMKRTTGLGMVIIDQLDKIRSESKHRDRFERLAEVTGDLKGLAKELGVPVITLAQRTRGAQRRDDPTPMIDDADAPSIERDGDWVLAVWRRENWLRKNRPNAKAGGEAMDAWEGEMSRARGRADVICLKRRRGQAFEQRGLKWNGPLTRFEEISG